LVSAVSFPSAAVDRPHHRGRGRGRGGGLWRAAQRLWVDEGDDRGGRGGRALRGSARQREETTMPSAGAPIQGPRHGGLLRAAAEGVRRGEGRLHRHAPPARGGHRLLRQGRRGHLRRLRQHARP